jgi:uncharacterized phage protein gp47/JayE
MPLINYNKDVALNNSLLKISRATGIDNFSRSSKIRAIAEIVTEDISTYIDASNDLMDNMYSISAKGRYLDLKGSEYGVYRNTISSVDIRDSDQIVRVEPREQDVLFSDIFSTTGSINRFDEITLGTNLKMVVTGSTQIGPTSTDVFLSVRIESSGTTGAFKINAGDTFKIPETVSGISFQARSLQIKFEKPISLETGTEEEEAFRERVVFARDNSKFGVSGAIGRTIGAIPGISGFAIYPNERGSGTVDIGIVTPGLVSNGTDAAIQTVKTMVEQRLRSTVAEGISYEVFIPDGLRLLVSFSFESEQPISDQTIVDSIYSAILKLNKYGLSNRITAGDIETEAERILSGIPSIRIQGLSLLDQAIGEYISFGANYIICPKGMYISVQKSDIVKE